MKTFLKKEKIAREDYVSYNLRVPLKIFFDLKELEEKGWNFNTTLIEALEMGLIVIKKTQEDFDQVGI